MRKRALCFLTILLTLALAGCSSSDDDGGGSSGGSGAVSICERDAGVYNYADGGRLEIMPNCEFIYTDPEGNYGHGIINSVSDEKIPLDLRVDSGPARGTCSTITATPDSFSQTNIRQC